MLKNNSRRKFIALLGKGLLVLPAARSIAGGRSAKAMTNHSSTYGGANTKYGQSSLSLNVRDFGAAGDGTTKDTVAIQQAIDRCSILGGGEVVVPAGTYLTGSITLRSKVLLRLEKDASIIGSADFNDYPVSQVRWEGKWIQGHTALIYAIDSHDTGITGPGKIIGNPALGGRPNAQNPLRHPALIEPINCNNLRFEDFFTSYHSMWSLHPTICTNIVIKNLTIRSTGGNGDGIDIDSCRHVTIDHCDIDTGDDCISLKSGRGMEGYTLLQTTEDVHITNCTFADSIFACIGIGSETSGGIRNVRIEHCKFTHAKTFALYIKSQPGRGAFIEDIFCNDLEVSGTAGGFLRLNTLGSGLQDQDPVPGDEGIPATNNFSFTNIRVTDVPVLVDATSVHPSKPLQGFTLKNISGTCTKAITMANMEKVKVSGITVTGFTGNLIGVNNVHGSGLEGAVTIDAPRLPLAVKPVTEPYRLH